MLRRVVFQLLSGLLALHTADIVHRDLKPENILVDLGEGTPDSLRLALCDFGSSRSVHGFRSKDDSVPGPAQHRRKASVRVTTCTYRCPAMWHWADTSHMTKRDLKSLDVFAVGLIWAELIIQKRIITHNETFEPQSFRLLEILRKVDRPSEADLRELRFTKPVCHIVQKVLSGETQSVFQPKLASFAEKHAKRASYWEALLRSPFTGMRKEILKRFSRDLPPDCLGALELIENAARFSYRKRTTVSAMLADPYFKEEVAALAQVEASPRPRAHSEALLQFRELHDALEVEIQKQSTLLKHHHGAETTDITAAVSSDAARIERTFMTGVVAGSVRKVCRQVRSEFAAIARRR